MTELVVPLERLAVGGGVGSGGVGGGGGGGGVGVSNGGGDSYSSTSYSGGESTQPDTELSSGYVHSSDGGGGDGDWPGVRLLPEVERCPWSEHEVLTVLREGRPKPLSGHITVEMMQHLCYVLQRPLLRLCCETRRSCAGTVRRCARHQVLAAVRIVLSPELAESCWAACARAAALHAMGGDSSLRKSISARCGLRFSVGKFHRWLVDAGVAPYVHESGAVAMAATMENLLEEVVMRALCDTTLGK